MFQAGLPKTFWNYAVAHGVFLINRVPSRFLNNVSPYEVLYGKLPVLSHLRSLGCLCYASTISAHRKKLDSRARKYVFLGYRTGIKGCLLYDLKSREIFISRNVQFYKSEYPFVKCAHPHPHLSPHQFCLHSLT